MTPPAAIVYLMQAVAKEVVADWWDEWRYNQQIVAWHVDMVNKTGGLAHILKQ